ncbi:MAG TPA: hypothetical protein VNI52_11850 [Sphingobacteriaceae bacterium]|nr:hypothetical protein [Sphingobacteriaceae bacterium]
MCITIKISIYLMSLAIIICMEGCFPRHEVIMGINLVKSRSRIFSTEYNILETFYQYHDLKGDFQFGELVRGKRNDTIFISGSKIVRANYILTRNKYYYDIAKFDYVETKFVKSEDNKIKLKEVKRYKDGKLIEEQFFQ